MPSVYSLARDTVKSWVQSFAPEYRRIATADPQDLITTTWPRTLTTDQVRSALEQGSKGYPREQLVLFDQMLESDGALRGAYETRIMALTGLEWSIEPANDTIEANLSAQTCRSALQSAFGVDAALLHIANAIGISVAVVELLWAPGEANELAGLVPVHNEMLQSDSLDIRRLHVLTEENRGTGEPLDKYPYKFIVHNPHPFLGPSPFQGGLHRTAAIRWLAKRLIFGWWTATTELFGAPVRMAKVPANWGDAEIDNVEDLLKNLGVNGYAVFRDSVQLDMAESSKSSQAWPHKDAIEHIDESYALLYLGQTLTTKVGETGGAYAAASVHDQVRRDRLLCDIRYEAQTIQRDLLKPIVLRKLGSSFPVPLWVRKIPDHVDEAAVGAMLDNAVNRLGLSIPQSWAHAALGLPPPAPGVASEPVPGGPLPEPSLPMFQLDSRSARHREVVAARLPKPKRTSPIRLLDNWISEAVNLAGSHARQLVAYSVNKLRTARTVEQARKRLTANMIDGAPTTELEAALRDYLLAAKLYGRYAARATMKARRAERDSIASTRVDATTLIVAASGLDLFKRSFREAVEALSERLVLDPGEFLSLDRDARSRAGRIAGQYNMRFVQDVYDQATAVLKNGGTIRDFQQAIKALPGEGGWVGEKTWHANLVFRQNASMAYASGTYEEMQEAEVSAWRYETYGDSCPICGPMDGAVFAMDDRAYYPPLHFNCDCWADAVFDGAEPTKSGDIDNPAYVESQSKTGAFAYDPAQFARLEALDLSGIPDDLQPAFREYAELKQWQTTG